MDHHHSGHVVTLVNSIIGVSILAMPYCFKHCGVILAFLILLVSNLLTRVTCHFLIKSANIARRRTFEHLAFHTFGSLGKFGVEIGMIGFLIGTCIAFFVVIGDLGPEIISEMTTTNLSTTMRTSILMALALFCVLPLGLLRNVDSLIGISKATIGFYVCLVLKIILEALPHLYKGDWIDKVELWKPSGVLQVLPIVSMALFCQTQLFEIYQAIENPTLEKLNQVVKSAVNTCTVVYFFVGFFGYVAFAHKSFGGNILMSFAPSFVTNAMKLGFILSLAFSFPLVIFPCRQSLYSLLYREGHSLHESMSNYIPEGKFKGITMFIVFTSLVVSILIPTIEVVLGLVGSTIGVMVCLIFPVACFICISQKDTNERLIAKFVLILGLFIMVLGTYTNLRTLETIESPIIENQNKNIAPKFKTNINKIKPPSVTLTESPNVKVIFNNNNVSKSTKSPEVRHEPPQPIEMPEEPKAKLAEKKDIELKIRSQNKNLDLKKEGTAQKQKEIDKIKDDSIPNKEPKLKDIVKVVEAPQIIKIPVDAKVNMVQEDKKNDDQVDIEAIKKDDNEMKLQIKDKKNSKHDIEEDHKILLENMQKQNEIQENLVKQQKRLIEVLEKQQEIEKQTKIEKEEKLKALKKIENLALKAIEKISGGDKEENKKASDDLEKKVNEVIEESVKTNDEPRIESKVKPLEIDASGVKEKTGNLNASQKNQDNKNLKKESIEQLNIVNKSNTTNDKHLNEQPESMEVNIVKETAKDLKNPEMVEKDAKNTDIKTKPDTKQKLNNKSLKVEQTNNKNIGKLGSLNDQNKINIEQPAPAPLFINLGQKNNNNVTNIQGKADVLKAVPVPVSLMNSTLNFTDNFTLDVNLNSNDKNLKGDNDEVKVLRRDILSYSNISKRKRK